MLKIVLGLLCVLCPAKGGRLRSVFSRMKNLTWQRSPMVIGVLLLLVLLLSGVVSFASAEENTRPTGQSFGQGTTGFKFSLDTTPWFAQGEHSLKGGPPDANNSWHLKHPIDNNMLLANLSIGEIKDNLLFSLDLSLGYGKMDDGKLVDTDYDASGNITDLSHSTSSGETILGSVDFSFCLTDLGHLKDYRLDLRLGYLFLKNSVEYNDPTILIDVDTPANEGTSTAERWQVYDLVYSGVAIGLKGYWSLGQKLRIEGKLGYLPDLRADYNGTRYPDRAFNEQQEEKITGDGTAFNYEIRVTYWFTSSVALGLGYKYLKFQAEGRDKSGTTWAGSWEEFETQLSGWLIGLIYNF